VKKKEDDLESADWWENFTSELISVKLPARVIFLVRMQLPIRAGEMKISYFHF